MTFNEPLCETCNGEGTVMDYACYGGPSVEIIINCPDCKGTGKANYEERRIYILMLCGTELEIAV